MPAHEFPKAISRCLLVGVHQSQNLILGEEVPIGLHISEQVRIFETHEGVAKNLSLKDFQQVLHSV
jgi:hypothetical protein